MLKGLFYLFIYFLRRALTPAPTIRFQGFILDLERPFLLNSSLYYSNAGVINEFTDLTGMDISHTGIGKREGKSPQNCINFILPGKWFAKALRSLETCKSVNNNLCEKLTSSLESSATSDERFKVNWVPSFILQNIVF